MDLLTLLLSPGVEGFIPRQSLLVTLVRLKGWGLQSIWLLRVAAWVV